MTRPPSIPESDLISDGFFFGMLRKALISGDEPGEEGPGKLASANGAASSVATVGVAMSGCISISGGADSKRVGSVLCVSFEYSVLPARAAPAIMPTVPSANDIQPVTRESWGSLFEVAPLASADTSATLPTVPSKMSVELAATMAAARPPAAAIDIPAEKIEPSRPRIPKAMPPQACLLRWPLGSDRLIGSPSQ